MAALAAAPLRQTGTAKAFPRAEARLYLNSGAPRAPAGLDGKVPPAPDASAVARAEEQLRQSAGNAALSQRERALAAFVLGKGEAERGETDTAAADLATAAAWEPARNAATAALVGLWARQHDPQQTLAAADKYPPARGAVFEAATGKPAARAAAQLQNWSEEVRWSARFPSDPEMIWLRAQGEDALGHVHTAAGLESTLEYEYPASAQAQAAAAAWRRALRANPAIAAGWARTEAQASAWTRAGRHREAAETWALAARLAPRSHYARIKAEETRAWLAAGDLATAATRLRTLLHSSQRPQALEIEVELARHQAKPGDITAALAALHRGYPHSRWYARALEVAGNEAVLAFDDAATQQRFDQLSRHFPHSAYAPHAAWRAAWVAFRLNESDAPQRMQHYLRSWPGGAAAPDALFWIGVWAGRHRQPALAQLCFQTAARRFPGAYFGQQAAQRIAHGVAADPPPPSWLRPFLKARSAPYAARVPTGYRKEVQQAEWMQAAGLDVVGAAILEHVLYKLPAGAASLGVARRLGAVESERGAWNQGMAAMIRAVPHYMELAPGELRASDWKLLFPAPYQAAIAAASQQFGLDRYLVLGLIRQESGFDPASVSGAQARGLMQLELGTARLGLETLPASWRQLKGPGRLSASDLLKPQLNLALGSAELHGLLSQFDDPVYALAGYNAGRKRVVQWQQQFPNLAMDAFIESVPFTQTRGYIQAVLRNATRYRQIYGTRNE
ncbi:MAG: transglycosylase SLT domain-containing protein [Terriglobales bacterium]